MKRKFQSTHPSGVRPTGSARQARKEQFQSTHPSGVRRHYLDCAKYETRYFNPRTPVGCDDPLDRVSVKGDGISIHAPQWGATQVNNNCLVSGVFQSTHPSGVRPAVWLLRVK